MDALTDSKLGRLERRNSELEYNCAELLRTCAELKAESRRLRAALREIEQSGLVVTTVAQEALSWERK